MPKLKGTAHRRDLRKVTFPPTISQEKRESLLIKARNSLNVRPLNEALDFANSAARDKTLKDTRDYRSSHQHIVQFFNEAVRPSLDGAACSPNGEATWFRAAFWGASMAYSWMPTIFRGNHAADLSSALPNLVEVARCTDASQFSNLLDRLSKSRDGGLVELLCWVNGSIVGTSKFLHFLNPAAVPIWDARVAANFGIFDKASIERVDTYKQYVALVAIKALDSRAPYSAYLQFLGTGSGLDARSIEFALFSKGEVILKARRCKKKTERLKANTVRILV